MSIASFNDKLLMSLAGDTFVSISRVAILVQKFRSNIITFTLCYIKGNEKHASICA